MNHDDQTGARPFWRSPFGMILIGFLAIAGFFLLAEHQAHLFAGEWGSALLLLVFIGLHFLMHAGHGGHGRTERSDDRWEGADKDRARPWTHNDSHGDQR